MEKDKKNIIKKKRPAFKQQDYFRYKRVGTRWRKPKGLQSKLREHKGGSGAMPSVGYRSPREIRGTVNVSGKFVKPFLIKNIDDLESAKDSFIIISSRLGLRKTKILAEKAKKLNIKILNMKKVRRVKKHEILMKKKKEERKAKEAAERKKAEKKKEEEKKASEKKETKKISSIEGEKKNDSEDKSKVSKSEK